MDSRNWEVEHSTDDTKKNIYINVCRSLVQQGGQCAYVFSFSKVDSKTEASNYSWIFSSHPRLTLCLPSMTGSWKCPSSAASCMKFGDDYVSLGQVESGPVWDRGVLKLQYSSGQVCPDGIRNRSSIIRFKCDKDKVVRDTHLRKCWTVYMYPREPQRCQSVKHLILTSLTLQNNHNSFASSDVTCWSKCFRFNSLYIVTSCCYYYFKKVILGL